MELLAVNGDNNKAVILCRADDIDDFPGWNRNCGLMVVLYGEHYSRAMESVCQRAEQLSAQSSAGSVRLSLDHEPNRTTGAYRW